MTPPRETPRQIAEKLVHDFFLLIGEYGGGPRCIITFQAALEQYGKAERERALEEAAKECDDKAIYERKVADTSFVSQYRKDKADGAEECAARIRALAARSQEGEK